MPIPSEKRGSALIWALLLIAGLVAGIALGVFGTSWYAPKSDAASAGDDPEPSRDFNKVVALGRIEPRDGILSLGVPLPDRIRRLLVTEGQHVKKDAPLAILDSEVMRKLEQKLAVIQRDQANERLKAIEENGNAQIHVEEIRREQIEKIEPLEIEALESKIAFLELQKRNAHRDYDRYVAAGDTIADQDKEKQKLAWQQVQAEAIATQSQLKKLRASRAMNLKVADAQLVAARAELAQSKSAVSRKLLDTQIDQADERLNETQVHAPSDGKILNIFVHEGELVHGQPILQMANVDNMIVRTEVYETDIERVKVGQKAIVSSHIFTKDKNALRGKVVWIAGSVGKAQVTPLDPRAAVDNRVVNVRVALDDPKPVADLIGHQVRVEILMGEIEKTP
jgi:HlyD family secretion protein